MIGYVRAHHRHHHTTHSPRNPYKKINSLFSIGKAYYNYFYSKSECEMFTHTRNRREKNVSTAFNAHVVICANCQRSKRTHLEQNENDTKAKIIQDDIDSHD